MKKLLLLIILFSGLIANAQNPIKDKNLIGFACFYSGTESKTVQKFARLLEKQKYKKIIQLLDAKTPAKQCLSAFICLELEKNNRIALSESKKLKVLQITKSDSIIKVCSGCTVLDKVRIRDFFDKNHSTYMIEDAKIWLKNYVAQE